jgi:hypothetical protein
MVYVTTTKSFEDKNANVFPPQYQDFKNAFKKKMPTYCHNINRMNV